MRTTYEQRYAILRGDLIAMGHPAHKVDSHARVIADETPWRRTRRYLTLPFWGPFYLAGRHDIVRRIDPPSRQAAPYIDADRRRNSSAS